MSWQRVSLNVQFYLLCLVNKMQLIKIIYVIFWYHYFCEHLYEFTGNQCPRLYVKSCCYCSGFWLHETCDWGVDTWRVLPCVSGSDARRASSGCSLLSSASSNVCSSLTPYWWVDHPLRLQVFNAKKVIFHYPAVVTWLWAKIIS